MSRTQMDQAIEQSAQRLLKVAIPPVRFWLLTYIMQKGPEDHDSQKALDESKRYGPRVRLLEKLREDGTWPISSQRKAQEDAGPGPPYGWTYITMLRNLYWLYEYCADSDEGYIEESLERIQSWQSDEGFIEGPEVDLIPRPYYNGFALSILRAYGRQPSDPRISRLADWLFRTQRRDGGWNIPYIQDMRYDPEYKLMRLEDFKELVRQKKTKRYFPQEYNDVPSCYWTSIGALRGLSWMPTDEQIHAARRCGDFVLDGFFKKNRHPGFYRSEANWTILKFPTFYGSGLTALDHLVSLGFGQEDPRMEEPIRWLLSARSKDGFWYQTDRPHAMNDQWLTVIALTVLAFYSRDSVSAIANARESPLDAFRGISAPH